MQIFGSLSEIVGGFRCYCAVGCNLMYFWCPSVPKLDFGPSVVSLVQDEDAVAGTDALLWPSDGQGGDDQFGFYASPQVFGLQIPGKYDPRYQGLPGEPETELLRSQG